MINIASEKKIMKKILLFLLINIFLIGNSFSYEGFVNDLLKENGYRIIHKEVDQSGQFHFILEHKKRKDLLICTSAMNYNGDTESICGRP